MIAICPFIARCLPPPHQPLRGAFLIALGILLAGSSLAQEDEPAGQCDITKSASCTSPLISLTSKNAPNQTGPCTDALGPIPGCYDAVRSSAKNGASTSNPTLAVAPIDVWGYCRYVDNTSSTDSFFVPLRTSNEWLAFINAVASGSSLQNSAQLTKCATATTSFPLPPASYCHNASPSSIGVPLPYDRAGSAYGPTTTSSSFTCTCPIGTAVTTWTETPTATFTAGASLEPAVGVRTGTDTGWSASTTYSDASTYTHACNLCGSDTVGIAATDQTAAPTGTAACASGTSIVAGSMTTSGTADATTWNWTCQGNGANNAFTSACQTKGNTNLCGTAQSASLSITPASNTLCVAGSWAGALGTNNSGWAWTCNDTDGNSNTCNVAATCGSNYTWNTTQGACMPTYTGTWTAGSCSVTCGGGTISTSTCSGGNGQCDPSTNPIGGACNTQICAPMSCDYLWGIGTTSWSASTVFSLSDNVTPGLSQNWITVGYLPNSSTPYSAPIPTQALAAGYPHASVPQMPYSWGTLLADTWGLTPVPAYGMWSDGQAGYGGGYPAFGIPVTSCVDTSGEVFPPGTVVPIPTGGVNYECPQC